MNLGKLFSRNGPAKNELIVVAGLAGLSAAFDLSHVRHKVTVLETQNHPGGRTTLREGFPDGLYAEAGAEGFYPANPDYALAYIDHFGLSKTSLRFLQNVSIAHLNGNRVTCDPTHSTGWPLPFTNEEQQLGLSGMRQQYIEPLLRKFQKDFEGDWPKDIPIQFDGKTFVVTLKEMGASDSVIELLRILDWDWIGGRGDELEMLGFRPMSTWWIQLVQTRNGQFSCSSSFNSRRTDALCRRVYRTLFVTHDDPGQTSVWNLGCRGSA